jgi:hypothetical protein
MALGAKSSSPRRRGSGEARRKAGFCFSANARRWHGKASTRNSEASGETEGEEGLAFRNSPAAFPRKRSKCEARRTAEGRLCGGERSESSMDVNLRPWMTSAARC